MAKRTKAPKAPKAVATFEAPVRVAPADRRGRSTVDNPVGVIWVTCINLTVANDGVPPVRRDLHVAVMGAGVAYYTARTQVQKFLKWHREGMAAEGLPRGITIVS